MKAASKPTEVQPLRVAGYLRVSTDEQKESGLGIDAQEEKIRAYAVMKDWPTPTFYVDDGVTGTIDITEREDGARLVHDIDAGKIDIVIVSSLDRVGRKAVYILNFVSRIKDTVQFASCKETIDTTTATGKFVLAMFAALAELERDTISERTRDALDARCRSVGIKAGRPPFGYFYVDDLVCIDEVKAAIVRRVYALREQKLTLRAIANRIEQETGKHIGFSTVGEILDREAVYRGGKRGDSEHSWPIILS